MSHQQAGEAGTDQPPREDCGLAPQRTEVSESPLFSLGRSASSPRLYPAPLPTPALPFSIPVSPQPRLGVYGLLCLVVGWLGRLFPQ